MPVPVPHLDLAQIDFGNVVADINAIRQHLPHRFEFEMLTAIVHIDPANHLVVGYRDVHHDEFWVRGHFPGHPILPGVLMCEAAAQLCSYYTSVTGVTAGKLLGLGGVDNTRIRRAIRPGERFVLVGKGIRVRSRYTQFNVQGFVDNVMCFHTDAIGVPLGRLEDL